MPNWEVNRVDEEIHITHRGTGKYIVLRYDGKIFSFRTTYGSRCRPTLTGGYSRQVGSGPPVRGLEAAVEELVVARVPHGESRQLRL